MFKPTTFGKFFLYEKLAIGGMAEIFKAKLYGIAGFEKTLVVKQILPEYASDNEFVKMFIDEANIAVSLTHGNIVPVYELGKIADRYYIAMEYVDGENLETIVDQNVKMRREIPVPLAVEIVIEVCKGLDYAHRKSGADGVSLGIVHRDVSPQNVMVSFDGEVKIVDFGIAKAASKLSLTRVGTLKGKFGYMSPEQAMGADVDRRTDIYAAGIVLYEILTGRKLFDAESDLDLLKKVRAGVISTPSAINPRIPQELDRLMLKALSRDANTRYQHAAEFQGDLQRWLYSRPEDPSAETLGDWMRGLFRREPLRAASPGAPQVVVRVEEDERVTHEVKSRRDVSYAQNDEIAQVLEQASREARRVMGDDVSGDHTVAHESSADLASAQTDERELSEESFGVERDDDAATGSNGSVDEVIEFDETTSNVASRLLVPESRIERPTIEGPIVRIPAKAARANRASPPPPWAAGPIPAPVNGDEKTRPGPPRPRREGSKPREIAAVSSPNVAVAPEDGPLFQRSFTRASFLRRARGLAFGLLILGGAGAGLAWQRGWLPVGDDVSPERTVTPAPSAAASETARVAAATSAPATPAPTPTTTATPVEAATRKATFETTPAGATVFLGAKKLGATPLTVPVATAELPVRFTKTGFKELKKTYPDGAAALRVSETLEAIAPRATPAPVEFGTISVNATPWGKVKIDGVFVKNTPLIKHRLKAGSHDLEVTNPDFPKKTQKKSVTVHANVDEDPIIVTFE